MRKLSIISIGFSKETKTDFFLLLLVTELEIAGKKDSRSFSNFCYLTIIQVNKVKLHKVGTDFIYSKGLSQRESAGKRRDENFKS